MRHRRRARRLILSNQVYPFPHNVKGERVKRSLLALFFARFLISEVFAYIEKVWYTLVSICKHLLHGKEVFRYGPADQDFRYIQ